MITLRKATLADLPILQHWDTQEHVVASDPNDDWNWACELGREPEWREQLVASINGQPIGFVQIIDPAREESHYWGQVGANKRAIDIWIGEAAFLGKGHGTEMMRQALERCFRDKEVTEVLIDPLASNLDAIRFYKKLGFTFVERRKFGEDDCEVYSMSRSQWLQMIRNESRRA